MPRCINLLLAPPLARRSAANFARGALNDAAAQFEDAGLDVSRVHDITAEPIISAAAAARVEVIVTPHAPTGWTASALDALEVKLSAAGLALVRPRRTWDNAFWPHATGGYSQLRQAISQELAAEGLL